MANIDQIRERVAIMLLEKEKLKQQKRKRKPIKAELYTKDRKNGMTVFEIAKKYGVSHQAVYKGLGRYRKRMEERR